MEHRLWQWWLATYDRHKVRGHVGACRIATATVYPDARKEMHDWYHA